MRYIEDSMLYQLLNLQFRMQKLKGKCWKILRVKRLALHWFEKARKTLKEMKELKNG